MHTNPVNKFASRHYVCTLTLHNYIKFPVFRIFAKKNNFGAWNYAERPLNFSTIRAFKTPSNVLKRMQIQKALVNQNSGQAGEDL